MQYVPDACSIPRTSGVLGRRGGLGEIVTAVLVTLLILALHVGVRKSSLFPDGEGVALSEDSDSAACHVARGH